MNHLRRTFYVCMVLLTVLAACAPKSTPTATAAPATAAPQTVAPVVASPTTVTAVPSDTTIPPTLITVNLAGPPMKLGSTYPYVDGTILLAVPGGDFIMGHGGSDNPIHTVTIGDLWIYSTKVTNQQFAFCVAQGKCDPPNLTDNPAYNDFRRVNDPVVGVTYAQGTAYCTFVHGALPTEAQWEKSARGPNGNLYPWGAGAPLCDLLNYNNCVGKTTNVIHYPNGRSYYGALDMEGNTYEWVADWYDPLYYRSGPAQDPLGPSAGNRRSVRSSFFRSNVDQVSPAVRFFDNPTNHRPDLGFRCVVTDPTYFAPYCQQLVDFGTNGAGGGGQPPLVVPTPDCQPMDVHSHGTCLSKVPSAIVVFTDPATLNENVPAGCIENPTDTFTCNTPGTASITEVCTVPPPPGPPGCSAGYMLVGNTCIPKAGSGGTCLPPFVYDPAKQCCSAVPGTTGNPYSLCPAGLYNDSKNGCVPWPTTTSLMKSATVDLGACSNGNPGAGTPVACTPPTNCYYGYDKATCICNPSP
jgi:formylglycine-generating enzyme required for sulfatase activity